MQSRIVRFLAAFALIFAPVAMLCPAQAQTMQAASCKDDMGGQTEKAPDAAKCAVGCGVILQFENRLPVWQELAADPVPLPIAQFNCFVSEVATPPPR